MRKSFLIAILDWHVLKKIDGFLIKRYVIKRSKKLNKFIPADINRKIFEFENMFAPDIWIRVSYMKDGFTSILNGKAVNPNGVLLTPEWAARLLLFNDDDTHIEQFNKKIKELNCFVSSLSAKAIVQ